MIYISLSSSMKDRLKDAVLELVQSGFLDIELGGGTRYYEGMEDDLFNLKKEYKINFLIHNYFPPPPKAENFVMNIASKDMHLRDRTFKIIDRAIGLTKKLGNDLFTIHPGYNRSSLKEKDGRFYLDANLEEGEGGQNTKEDFYEGIDFLLKNVIKDGFRIGIENHFSFDKKVYSFLDSREDIIEFLDYYKGVPNIGLLLDLAHLDIASNCLGFDKIDTAEEIFTDYPDKIFEIHISANEASKDSHNITDFDSWQIKLVRQNKKRLKDIPIVFEWCKVCNSKTYEHFEGLREFLES